MRPGTKRVAIVAGTTPNNIYSEQIFRKSLESYLEKLELIDLTKLPMEETLARVGSLPPDTIVLYAGIHSDGKGQSFVPREALSNISRAANAPVFGLFDSFMGYGIVGGRLASWEQQGREAAAIALRIMGGESAASIPFGGERAYVDLYDWRELRHWNIPESLVPPGSEIRFRPPSPWDTHREGIIAGIALISTETFLIFGLVINLRRRRLAERSLSESEARLSLAAASANAGMWSMSVDTGQVWVTDKIRELFGFSPHVELHYEDFLRVTHLEDR
jgi:PAS domain-containing protein